MRSGLRVDIFRNAARSGDTTNGGISSRYSRLTITGVLNMNSSLPTFAALPERAQPFKVSEDAPEAWLCLRNAVGSLVWSVIPANDSDMPHSTWVMRHMAGGNFASTSDSRFRTAMEPHSFYGAVAIHDRRED